MSNLTATEKAKAAKREYMRKWRAEHKDLVKASQDRYWTKQFEKMAAEN